MKNLKLEKYQNSYIPTGILVIATTTFIILSKMDIASITLFEVFKLTAMVAASYVLVVLTIAVVSLLVFGIIGIAVGAFK